MRKKMVLNKQECIDLLEIQTKTLKACRKDRIKKSEEWVKLSMKSGENEIATIHFIERHMRLMSFDTKYLKLEEWGVDIEYKSITRSLDIIIYTNSSKHIFQSLKIEKMLANDINDILEYAQNFSLKLFITIDAAIKGDIDCCNFVE